MESREYSQVNAVEANDDAAADSLFQKRRCCFCFSWRSNRSSTPAVGLNWWQRARSLEINPSPENSFWARGISALKKIREWSEIAAGPRWKTFIRRFSRTGRRRNNNNNFGCNYQYDPLSYSLNFDEGTGQNGDFDDGEEDYYGLRNFSVRYATVNPASAKASMDLDKDGPNFV
ncbi:uncharacterized protein [Coffea arabica]|uniref:Uncharacterized protein n=1 Tax=Coffea arabica TaxID=13443 RepID=A0A6P6XDM0_COFAR|nr:uncharacterized protein LOC113741606 [Coffea arabica]